MTLGRCDHCQSFIPEDAICCPDCRRSCAPGGAFAPARWPRLAHLGRTLIGIAGGSVVAVTLMACYGAPAHYRPAPATSASCAAGSVDADGDGACAPTDCDDGNPAVNPSAVDDAGDGVDQNCDGADGIAPAPAGVATDPEGETPEPPPADGDTPAPP